MIYEIINPSDPYTLETEDFDAAALCVWHVGQGQLGLRAVGGEKDLCTPVLFGWHDWARGRYLPDHDGYTESHWRVMAAACESVWIGPVESRQILLAAAPYMAPEAFRDFRREQYDRQRTSLNRIGEAFWNFATALRRAYGDPANAHV